MQTVDTVIEPRWVLPIVPYETVLENHALVIDQGRILDILPAKDARSTYAGRTTECLPHSLVLPGFVNLHAHSAMNILRGMGADLPLMDWLTTRIWPAEGKLMSAEFVEEGSFLAGLEMAASGITCASDHYFFPESAARGLRRAGIRAAVSGIVIGFPGAWARTDDEYLEKAEALVLAHQDDPFVHATIGPHAPYTVGDRALSRCAEISERYGVPVHMHVNETAGEVSDSLRDHGERPVERLGRLGLLNERLVAVHSVHASDGDIERMAEARVSVCHCPSSNLKLASGFAPTAKYLRAGINLGIGTDGAASNDKLDMLAETRLAAMLAKAVAGDTTIATVHQMLRAATLGGARALHWDKDIGSLEKEKAADMIAVDLSGVESLPIQDPAAQLLYAAGRENIHRTWVAGKLISRRDESAKPQYGCAISPKDLQTLAEKWQNRV